MSAGPVVDNLEWAVAERALPGEATSGDGYVVAPFRGGTLVAVVDGLGHGAEAAEVTGRAVAVLAGSPDAQPVALIERCHEALTRSRGVAMTLARLDWPAGRMTWIGVGNVEGRLLRANGAERWDDAAPLRGGVVGYQLPRLRPAVVPFGRGDVIVLATDGVRADFDALRGSDEPQRVADRLLEGYGRSTDDALVLVARHSGAAG